MDDKDLKSYRNKALDRLEQLLIQLPEEVNDADLFVDTYLRKLSQLPDRPEGAPPYKGLYGEKGSWDEYRDLATDRLLELVNGLSKLEEIDEEIDKQIRLLSNLPEKPADREPYTGLFVLRQNDVDEMDLKGDQVAVEKEYVSAEQLISIAGSGQLSDRIKALTPGVNATFEKYQINTKLRMAHFLAQVMHESGGFQWLREIWGPTATQKGYEGRRDLGNTQAGDGKRFMGRGLIQLTGRANYQQFSKDLGVDFIATPELVEKPPYAVLVAGWFWNTRSLNQYADKDDLRSVTRRINGGYNGIADREKYLKRAKVVLK